MSVSGLPAWLYKIVSGLRRAIVSTSFKERHYAPNNHFHDKRIHVMNRVNHRANHHSYPHAIITFDEIEVDADAHTLHCNHVLCDLEPKAFSVLQYLLAYPGEVVTKDELLDAIWTHRCVTPNVLARVITQIRHALGDSARQPRYIETVPTIGYRFIADIQHNSAQNGDKVNQESIFKKDMAHSSALLDELKILLAQLDGERDAYPVLRRHLSTLVNLFGDKPSGMVLYELALQYGLEKLNSLDLELPWRNGKRRATDKDVDEDSLNQSS